MVAARGGAGETPSVKGGGGGKMPKGGKSMPKGKPGK